MMHDSPQQIVHRGQLRRTRMVMAWTSMWRYSEAKDQSHACKRSRCMQLISTASNEVFTSGNATCSVYTIGIGNDCSSVHPAQKQTWCCTKKVLQVKGTAMPARLNPAAPSL